ncbi:MAG: SMC-Scp complex subunit ScpB [Hyphomicrobium sp.]|nr:SMC-Scp complex subunit ScpB [Hyphomicrobium sp.]
MTGKNRNKTMNPPRLKLVTSNEDVARDAETDDTLGAEARELAAALADAQIGFAPDFGDRQEREHDEAVRIVEALLFAAKEPLDEATLGKSLPKGIAVAAILADLKEKYGGRGVNLVRAAGKWAFRTAEDLSWLLEKHASDERRLSKAALETLAIIAYHQPVTRAEIEEVRGVATSAGTLDILLETGWVRPRGRRRAPGKPITYGTTDVFLSHFGLDSIRDLPGLQDLKAQGLLDSNLPPGFTVPEPRDVAALLPDELPLEADDGENDDQGKMELDLPADDEAANPALPEQS